MTSLGFLAWVKAEWTEEVIDGLSLEEQQRLELAFNAGHKAAIKGCIGAINALPDGSPEEQRVKLEAQDCCRTIAQLNRTGGLKP